MSIRALVNGLVVIAAALGAGCVYRDGGIVNPITRKFQYFSYLGGDDIRSACVPGEPARYRLVYNGVYDEQVRAYELRRNAAGAGAVLHTQVFGGGGNLAAGFNPLDPTGPWRGVSSEIQLDEATYLALIRSIEASGFGEPAPRGLTLPSWGFYWVVAACADGRFHFNAWLHPGERFDRIQFDRILLRLDGTNVAVNPPRPLNAAEHRLASGAVRNDPTISTFDVRVGQNGLVGDWAFF
jgi:hypothetical protein